MDKLVGHLVFEDFDHFAPAVLSEEQLTDSEGASACGPMTKLAFAVRKNECWRLHGGVEKRRIELDPGRGQLMEQEVLQRVVGR